MEKKKKQKTRRGIRRLNYGEGNLFDFHGTFTEKAKAVAKERQIPGAFIRTVWFKGGPRYGVLTKKNSVVWGNGKGKKNAKRKKSGRRNGMAWGGAVDPKRDTDAFHKALKELYPGKEIKDLSTAEMSKVSQLAWQMLHGGKKNPVIKVAGGWRAVGARGRISPVLPSRRDAEIYAESLKMNPPARPGRKKSRRRRNYADSTELYTKFHGRGPRRVTDTGLPTADYDDHPELGQLGRMVSLTIGDAEAAQPWKKKIQWGHKEAPDLASEPGGRQLYIIGGSQDLDGAIDKLPLDDADKDTVDLGFAYQIEYFTQKNFDKFQPVTYYHDLGEETGQRPRVVYDRVKKRIHLVGGAYEVKPEGIVN